MTNRVVFDTNVLVSAALFRKSVPGQAFEKALLEGDVLVSKDTNMELVEVLDRPKFDKYLTRSERLQFVSLFLEAAITIAVSETIIECRDPKDNKFLELAISGNATHIVSGDDDLLELNPFREITILHPQAFLTTE
ncbi:MAG: putative toxin-antitoxin system toxin component, PIN family [Chloroflexi bacterium]|nr:putative toxin-antitoxin system toxin component, PIN family [Chloroflexota bacterium]